MTVSMCDVAKDLRPGEEIRLYCASEFEIEVRFISGGLTMSNRVDNRDFSKFYFDPIGEAVERLIKSVRGSTEVQTHRLALAKE